VPEDGLRKTGAEIQWRSPGRAPGLDFLPMEIAERFQATRTVQVL